MDIGAMQVRAMQLRERFAEFEKRTYGQEWSTEDLVMGSSSIDGWLDAQP